MKKRGRRKCQHCGELYSPDPRTRDRQRFCSKAECRRESKRVSQQKWLNKAENRGYFKGPHQVERTRVWRKEHPGYWRGPPLAQSPLQDEWTPQPVENKQDSINLVIGALQDELSVQPALLVGLISILTGSALQDEIVPFIRNMQVRGQQILGMGPGSQQGDYHAQTANSSRPCAPGASAVQLGGSASGP